MADYFFYGSLMDSDVLSAVAGERIEPSRLVPARLSGYVRLRRSNSAFPLLVEVPDESEIVEGVLVRGIGAAATRRLDRYESDGYVLIRKPVTMATGTQMASLYVPSRPGRATGQPWDFETWRRRHKRRLLRALKSARE